ncbi:hypothetical protein [Microcystis phage Mwe-JY05]
MPATGVVVLSGKGGTAKTLWQATMASEASRAGRRTLLVDVDPERNLSNRFGAPAHSTGLGNVLDDAGASADEADVKQGAARVTQEIVGTRWEHVELLPAGASLSGVSQVNIPDTWLLRDIFTEAGIPDRYDLVLFDTGGRVGSLVTQAMYAADVAYAPISPTTDAVRKAIEARARVERIQRAHPLRWAGVVLSGFDVRAGIEDAIRATAIGQFADELRAEVPRRTAVNEAFQVGDRLGDRRDVSVTGLADIFRGFLERDLMQLDGAAARYGAGVLR